MIHEDRELLAELARLNTDMAALGMRILDDSAGAAEQAHYANRLIAAEERLRRRAETTEGIVIEGDVVLTNETGEDQPAGETQSTALPPHTAEPFTLDWEP